MEMKNFFEIITGSFREKAEYKAYRKLLESLPNDYQYVLKEIEKYVFSFVVDENIMTVLMNTSESFAIAANDGRSVFSIIGEDIGSFCDNIIKNCHVKTWRDKQREKMNENIRKKFGTNNV
jgi:DNA-binding ferritin-like protein (Dps family)